MSKLPPNWIETEIGNLAQVVAGGTPQASDETNFAEPGTGVAWLTPADLSGYKQKEIAHGKRDLTKKGLDSSSAKLMPKGAVVFSSRAPIGYVAIAANEICTNQGFKSFVFTEHVHPSYAFYYLKSIKDLADSWGTGTTFKELSGAVAKKLPFKLAPLNEQIRIADKLDSILAKVNKAQARLDKIPGILKRFRQSVLAAATSGELTRDWREENVHQVCDFESLNRLIQDSWLEARLAEFKRKGRSPSTDSWLNKKPIPCFGESIAPSWISVELGAIAEVIDPNPSHRMPKYVDDGKPFISSENIVNNASLNFGKGKKITEEELNKQKERYEIVEGAFAFTRIGSIGKSVLLPTPHDYGISHAMAVVIPYTSVIDSKFLMLTMNCESILKQALHGVQSVGVPDLGIGKMKSFQIPLPSIKEQQEIVRRVSDLLVLATNVENQFSYVKSKISRLTESILARAFRGELVLQDANDEPASELLKRIKSSEIERKTKPKAIAKSKLTTTTKTKISKQAVTGLNEQLEVAQITNFDAKKHEVIDSLRVSYKSEIQKAQDSLMDAKFSVEQFRSITDFKGGYDELKALIMNLLKGIPSVSEPLLAIESWDEKSGDYLMRLVKKK